MAKWSAVLNRPVVLVLVWVLGIAASVATVFGAVFSIYVYYRPLPDLSAKPIESVSVAEKSTPTNSGTPSLNDLTGAWVGVSNKNICHKILQTGRRLAVENYDSSGKPIHENGTGVVKTGSIVIINMTRQNSDKTEVSKTQVSMTLNPPSNSDDGWHLIDRAQGNDWTYVGDDCPRPPRP